MKPKAEFFSGADCLDFSPFASLSRHREGLSQLGSLGLLVILAMLSASWPVLLFFLHSHFVLSGLNFSLGFLLPSGIRIKQHSKRIWIQPDQMFSLSRMLFH